MADPTKEVVAVNAVVNEQKLDPRGDSDPSFIEVGGVNVAYRRAGSGTPLLWIHGMGLANSWLQTHADLAKHHDVIAPQLPGFGRTARPAWYRSVDDFVPLLADFLDALGIDKVHLAGHSLGGLVAGSFGATYPERLLSATIVAPLALPVVIPPALVGEHDGPAPANLMAMLFNDNEAKYSEYDPPEDYGVFIAEADDEYSDPSAFSFDPAPSLYRRLVRIKAPAQVLVPEKDHVSGDPQVFEDWAKWLGDAPIVQLLSDTESTGHMFNLQVPEKFAKAIVDFTTQADNARR